MKILVAALVNTLTQAPFFSHVAFSKLVNAACVHLFVRQNNTNVIYTFQTQYMCTNWDEKLLIYGVLL